MPGRLAPHRVRDEEGQPQADREDARGIEDAQAPYDRGAGKRRADVGGEVEAHGMNLSFRRCDVGWGLPCPRRSEEHTSELQSLMRISYAVFCLKKKIK